MPAGAGRGPPHLYVLIGRDITERRAETHAARTLNNLLAKAFLVADVPLAIVNSGGRFVMTNQSMEAQLGCEGPAGQPAANFVAPHSRAAVAAALDTQQTGAPCRSAVDLQRADGTTLPVMLSSVTFSGLDLNRFSIVTVCPPGEAAQAPPPQAAAPKAASPTHYQVAGRLRFIDLEEVRESLKQHWNVVGARIMDSAEQIIRKRVRGSDQVSRDSGRGFTICFATGSENQASLRATAIASEIRSHLINLGEDESTIAMQVAVARIPVLAGMPAMDQIASQLDTLADAGLRAARAPLEPPRIRRAYRAHSPLPVAVHISPAPPPGPSGSVIISDSMQSRAWAPLHWLAQGNAAPQSEPMLVDIDFELFVRRDRTEALLAACATLPPTLRAKLYICLTNLPAGVTTSLMQEIVTRLKPFCAGVGWHLPEWSAPSFDLRECQLAWAVADLSGWTGPPWVAPQRLARVAARLAAHGIKCLATGVASTDAMQKLDSAGIHCATLVADTT